MGTAIYYFSGTGNSLAVARDLAAELGEAEVVAVPMAMREGAAAGAECVGVVFPVYFGGLPLIVDAFLQQMPAAEYTFAVATHGSMPGLSLRQAQRTLGRRGIELAAGFAVEMPGNYIRLYGAPPEAKQQKLFARWRERASEVAAAVQGRVRSRPPTGLPPVNWVLAAGYRVHFARRAHTKDRDFRADEKCNGCGWCAQVCPVGNIAMRDGRPVWGGRCEQCYACMQWCPEEAIQVGKRTASRRRYHHPDVSLEEMVLPREA
jgi:ferredoxin